MPPSQQLHHQRCHVCLATGLGPGYRVWFNKPFENQAWMHMYALAVNTKFYAMQKSMHKA
eukprot:8293645-Lingulodinium_polyedra.AAC.1